MVVGTDIVDTLMPGVDPIGKEIRIDGWIYRIIGVGKKKGSTLGQSLDNYVFMPHHVLVQGVRQSTTPTCASPPRRSAPATVLTRPWTRRESFCAPGGTIPPAAQTRSTWRTTAVC